MQKLFYCVYIKSTNEKLSTFIENMLSNIQSSVQNSSDDTASFMYLFDNTRNAVVGIYSAENAQKLPQAVSMYVNSLNSEAQMMGAIFEDIDTTSSDFERSKFTQVVSNSIPAALPTLNGVLGTENPNANKPPVTAPETTNDLFGSISSILPQDGTEEETNYQASNKPKREVVLLEEILDKLNNVIDVIETMSTRIDNIENKLHIDTPVENKSEEVGSELGKQKEEEIKSIGGIPEIPTYEDDNVTEPTPEKIETEEPKVPEETNIDKMLDEAHKENIAVGSEVATPNEVSLAETQAPSPEDEQSMNGVTSTIVDTNLTPEVKRGSTEEDITNGLESAPSFSNPKITTMNTILNSLTEGTESELDNYIISNRNNLSNSDLDLYCTYDFIESVKQNKLVDLDRVTSIKHKLETGRL